MTKLEIMIQMKQCRLDDANRDIAEYKNRLLVTLNSNEVQMLDSVSHEADRLAEALLRKKTLMEEINELEQLKEES